MTVGGSFTDEATATRLDAANLIANADNIQAWLNDPTKTAPKAFWDPLSNADKQTPVGSSILKSTGLYVNLGKVRTVLVKDPTRAIGFYVLTSFPEKS